MGQLNSTERSQQIKSGKTGKKVKTDMLRSIGKQSAIRGVSPGEGKEGYGGKELQKRKVSNLE